MDAKGVYAWEADKSDMAVKPKARLVARGFKHQEGRDFIETFGPIPAAACILLLASNACELD